MWPRHGGLHCECVLVMMAAIAPAVTAFSQETPTEGKHLRV